MAISKVLPLLTTHFPRTVKWVFEGPTISRTLTRILTIHGMQSLAIRVCTPEPTSMTSPRHRIRESYLPSHMDPKRTMLDFRGLSSLRNLRSLTIASLIADEVDGLACSICSMDLEYLKLDCYPCRSTWFRGRGRPGLRHPTSTSPLVTLFMLLATPTSHGLPRNLKNLMVSDYDSHKIPLLFRHVATAVARCPSLKTLGVNYLIDDNRFRGSNCKFLCATYNRLALPSWHNLLTEGNLVFEFLYLGHGGEKRSINVLAEPQDHPQESIVAILDNMTPTDDNAASTVASTEFIKDDTIPCHVVMVVPRGCDHVSYPALCFPCARRSFWTENLPTEQRKFNLELDALCLTFGTFQVDRGQRWEYRGLKEMQSFRYRGSWARQLNLQIKRYNWSLTGGIRHRLTGGNPKRLKSANTLESYCLNIVVGEGSVMLAIIELCNQDNVLHMEFRT